MSRFRLRHVLPFLAGLSLIGVLAFTPDLLAQSESLTEVGDASGLGSEDPRIIIANIIRTFLTVLGVLAVLIVLYGGWVWMTAGGNAEKVEKAKKILIRGGIGIAIILMSWAITTFVITALLDSTGGSGGSGDDSDGSGGGVLGGGSTTSFSVTDYSPEGAVSIRNVQLRVTFSKTLDDETVEGNIVVTNASSGEAVDGAITVSGNKATFVPSAACPSPNEDRSCFDADTEFTVTVSEAIESSSGTALTCGADDCTSSFTTGSLVDTEDPVAEITDPERGDGVEAGSVETIQVHATDDTEVSGADFSLDEEEFDSVGAEGDDLSDVTIESTWDTTELTVGQDYEISVTVTDIAGNTDGVSVDVTARGAWCFNDEIDEEYGETGLNCGGDSSSAEYCGACDGSSCTEDSECSSGSCVDGVCTTLPEIESVSPGSGAVGTYVTVSGSGFGTSTGTVAFTSEDGTTTVEADIPSCSDGWSDTEIVVEVPEGAGDGPITVTTDDDLSDATDDDAGALIDDFDVNDTERPKLCSLFPDEGESTDGTTLSGLDFGDEQGSSTVSFGTSAAGSYTSWEDTSASVTVPALEDGEYDVVVTVDGVESNAVTYTVEEDTTGDPVITGIDPSEGAVGDYITISGENFGILVGTVRLVDDAGNEAVAEVDFPEECAEDYWEPTEITVIVPEEYQSGDGLSAGAFDVYVVTQEGAESDTTSFTVEDGDPSPGICAIDPDVGLAGTSVTIYGERLGSDEGSVAFYDEDGDVAATVDEDGWSSDAISLTVPSGAETGPVTVTSSAGDESNSIDFEVSDAGAAETETEPASYGWYFSTGEIPETPELLVECSDDRISGVPNNRFTSDGVCVEAMVYGEFSTVMNEGSITDALTVEMCTAAGEQPCDTTTDVTGDGTLEVSSSTTSTTFSWSPSSTFTADTTYRVTVSTAAMSDEAQALDDDVSWEFTTASSSETCEVDTVHVVPSAATITEQYATEQFTAVPADGCVVVDGDDYTWDWYVYSGVANLTSDDECAGGTTDCTLVEALAEGEADVIAEETASTTSGQADLTVAFTDPYVSDYWPDCDQACSNGEIGASFNTAVTSTSLETDGRVELYECDNELCAVGPADEYGSYDVVATDCDDDDPSLCAGVAISPDAELTPGTYYRAVISRRVETPSGVSLTRTNYDTGFSWVFRVMEGDATCAVERIEVTPVDAVADAIGDRQTFTVDAYGTPDACSVAGQLLSASDYDWSYGAWSDDGSDAAVDVADWWDVGSSSGFVDTSIEDVPEGCTASCIPSGSTALDAVCGDGTVDSDAGEECEDGNTADDDGCSSSCLYEGSETTCGDDVVDTYEECDDGGIADGDGCSSVCLNEGSRAIGTTCGNDDVAYEADQGGEDCDDGNVVNGDGCSSVCLNEGSLTLTDVGGAVCGDLDITEPYETCDDGGTTDGDGCSSNCTREGADGSYGTCGNDSTEQGTYGEGEDCDGEEWCTDSCTYGGSSVTYSEPSFCGDGTAGLGEVTACESSGGDDNTDSLQLAYITDDAAQEVDTDTNVAIATVTVTEPESGLSTDVTYTLACSAATDTDCSDPETYGVGLGNCCIARPTATLYPNGTDACRNAAIYGIFTQEMDLGSFSVTDTDGDTTPRMYLVLDTSTTDDGACPYDDELAWLGEDSWIAETWLRIRRIVTGHAAEAAPGEDECVLPVSSYAQEAQDDGTFKVRMRYGEALEADVTYTLRIEVDSDNTDTSKDGVLSADNVAMYDADGVIEETFSTGSEICTLDSVVVEDTDDESPYYFSQYGEEHTFTATAYSYNGSTRQELESIDDVYSWTWSSWEEEASESVVDVAQSTTTGTEDEAAVEATGENGEAVIVATATIEDDVVGDSEGEEVTGSEDVVVYLCQNTWPDITATEFPWSDDEDGIDNGAEEGNGWMNFSTYFCRDSGEADDTSDDLPGVNVVYATDYSSADDILKEYLFEVDDGSGDAIGFRIVSNSEYLGPEQWFEAQGFSGSPQTTTIDGFQAVTDGRTTYVAAPNQSDTSLYSNIYVISYNEGASEETTDLYDQILENISFAINVDNDCDAEDGETCTDAWSTLQRDTKRLADLTTVAALVETYVDENGVVPPLSSGTYVRSMGSSVWDSWGDLLGAALGDSDLPTDPRNTYDGCGADPFASYDEDTCVNETAGQYLCPEGSYAYHYRAVGTDGVTLYADLEYDDAAWVNPIDADTSDDIDYEVYSAMSSGDGFTSTAFCDGSSSGGTVYGSTGSCGDGVVNTSIDSDGDGTADTVETCEIGESGGTAEWCDSDLASDGDGDGDPLNDWDGSVSQTCNSACTGWTDDSDAECVLWSCGDGVVDTTDGEECDDGALNGQYGYCSNTCSYDDAFYCGDGSLAGSETCDCGAPGESTIVDPTQSRPYGGTSYSCVTTEGNGTYDENPYNTCAWDCQGPASYCGDGVVDSGEECDGDTEHWEGKLCNLYSTADTFGQACETDADCERYSDASLPNALCGDASNDDFEACPETTVCVAGTTSLIGTECTADSDCGTDGACSDIAYQTYRTRTCEDDGASGETCDWDVPSLGLYGISCTALGSCGDGTVDDNEECDDGNDDSTDSCTNECTDNVCGDGYLYVGEEQCDEGTENGQGCSSSYESTCTSCSETCRYETSSGDFCGDGEINGDEYCDAYAMPYQYAISVTYDEAESEDDFNPFAGETVVWTYGDSCDTLGETVIDYADESDESDVTYTCSMIGYCNGGDSSYGGNGDECLTDSDCDEGDCVMTVCADDCDNTCPETYESTALLLTAEQPGATAETAVDLYTYSDSGEAEVPNSATITFPACTIASSLVADISMDNVELTEYYIVFVTDTSGSMDDSFDGSQTSGVPVDEQRITAAVDVLREAIQSLYDASENMHIALVQYDDTAYEETSGDGGPTAFTDADQESNLLSTINSYYVAGGTTETDDGLAMAKALLDSEASDRTSNVRKIIVLLSDGEENSTSDAGSVADEIKAVDLDEDGVDDYELYTVALTSVDTLITTMNGWSSNSGSALASNNIDYAYDGDTEDELEDSYEDIVASIAQPTIAIISSDGSTTYTTTDEFEEGSGVDFPWPEGFSCDQDDEQELPIRITFPGEGTIEISNVRFEYCAP